ncbi:MAG: HIRAN domain-containing protein, partial [Thermoguttaceae bacterium]|nr:HIRAN domain-containing protein [Thermoguttaceae bacterium]
YIEGIAKKTVELAPGAFLVFRREPGNSHDPLAILILNSQNEKIGYVPHTKNEVLANLMDGGKLLFGRVEEKRTQGDWIHIAVKVYMRDI